MDENDDPVDGVWLLTQRFPGLKDFFVKVEPELKDKIMFANDQELQQAIESVAELVQEKVWEAISDWEMDDEYYLQYLRDEGYIDDDGEIDYDRAPGYTEYNDHADRWSRDIWNTVTPSPEELRDIINNDPYEYGHYDRIEILPALLGIILREKYRGNRDEGDANIGQWLKEKVSMKKQGDKWQAYVVPSLRLPQQ